MKDLKVLALSQFSRQLAQSRYENEAEERVRPSVCSSHADEGYALLADLGKKEIPNE